MIHNLSTQPSIVGDFVRQLRDVSIQRDAMRFRQNLRRIGQIMAYEISKSMDFSLENVETPLGIASGSRISERIVLATILRAGLPLHEGLLQYFSAAENAFIASYRKHHKDGTFEIAMEYATFPPVVGKTLILTDSMIATGSSIEHAITTLEADGPAKKLHIVSVLASQQGVNRLSRLYPHAHIWTAAIDDELTAKSYIVPGLGDAGDLAYGSKNQD